MLLLNFILTFVWIVLTQEITIGNTIFGFILSLLIIGLTERTISKANLQVRQGDYVTRVFRLFLLIAFFLSELVKASFQVLFSILKPSLLRPGVIAIPLDLTNDAQITLLGNLITLTPGTLTLDVSTDKKVIYVHSIRVDDPEAFRQEIKNGFERRILEVF
ncbi:MAG: Na+/H+ antiporter subunit E [Anaerolineales bacterium]|nr:Na+/H+ antiporter subunit E [Anaerolineales bacterium]